MENGFGEVLWIYRLKHWDLPKGKLEKGEDIEQCALREVQEECGLSGLTLGAKLTETHHEYDQNGIHILKTTHWYRMTVMGRPELSPQTEEGIEWVRWVNRQEWEGHLGRSYATIQEVAAEAMRQDA